MVSRYLAEFFTWYCASIVVSACLDSLVSYETRLERSNDLTMSNDFGSKSCKEKKARAMEKTFYIHRGLYSAEF